MKNIPHIVMIIHVNHYTYETYVYIRQATLELDSCIYGVCIYTSCDAYFVLAS